MMQQSLLVKHESERNKILKVEILKYKKKISAQNDHALKLEVQLDKCKNGKFCESKQASLLSRHMLNKKSTVHGQQVHGEIFHEKLPEKDSRNEKFLNCVNINEIEFTCNKESQRVILGEGSFGICYLAQLKRSRIFVAVKLCQKHGNRYKNSLKLEAKILSRLSHPNIPFFFGIIEGETPGLIIEFLGDATKLSSLTVSDASQHLKISCSDWQEIMRICCSAFVYLHNEGILHNDIKGNNVLLTLNILPTVIDFGKATFIDAKDKYPPLTETQIEKYKKHYRHIAPELYLQRLQKSVSSDIYSFGWMLKCLQHCFLNTEIEQIFIRCLHSCPSQRPLSMSVVEDMLKSL